MSKQINNFIPRFLSFKNIYHIFILLASIIKIKCECSKETPIKIGSNCLLQYCTEQQYKDKECIIDNQIIKTQWLNNIIRIGEKNFRYINFAIYSNGDLVVQTTSCPCSSKRMFYGIKSNGRAFFNNITDSKKTYFYSIEAKDQPSNTGSCKYEGESFIAKINDGANKGKEYVVNFSKTSQYTELYLFDENDSNQIPSSELFGTQVGSQRSSTFNFIIDNINYTLISYVITVDNKNYIYFKKLNFFSNIFAGGNPSISSSKKEDNLGNSVSCFVTEQKYIICIYLCKVSSKTSICLVSLDQNFVEKKRIYYSDNVNTDASSFLKCIHLKKEVGAFIYYFYTKLRIGIKYYEVIYPIILLKNFYFR